MIGLSFDTCFKQSSVALFLNGKTFTLTEERPAKQSESLAKMTEKLLIENNIEAKDLNFLLCTKGPGSFTGIRIGLSFMEGLAFGIQVKTLYLQSFASALGEFPETELYKKNNILVILKAIRETFYVQMFSPELKPIEAPQYLNLAEVENLLKEKPVKLFGNFEGFEAFKEDIIANSALINSENNLKVMQKFPWLLTADKTPFYFREAIGGKTSEKTQEMSEDNTAEQIQETTKEKTLAQIRKIIN
jgi:tRNA threonylcarbamoyladenosine biosynthesis protein TsaB